MPAITLGFAEFEARLDRIRRRLNTQILIETGCIAGSAVMIAAAAILIAETNLGPTPAVWVRRAAFAAVGLSVAGALWRLYSRWLDLENTARLVDRRAQMEDRLSTLLANPNSETRSPLRAILAWQIFHRSAQWEAERVAPIRFRRPAIFTTIALAVLAFAVWQAHDDAKDTSDATAVTASAADVGSTDLQKLAGAGGIDKSPGSFSSGPRGIAEGNQPGEGGGSQIGLGDDGGPRVSHGAADRGVGGQENGSGNDQRGGLSPNDVERDGENEGGLADKRGRAAGQGDSRGARIASLATPIAPPRDTNQLQRLSAETENQGPARGTTEAATNQTPPAAGDKNHPDAGGSVAGAREHKQGAGANAAGVLGERNSAEAPQSIAQTEPMVIQLKSFAMNQVENYEPQGKAGGSTAGAGGGSRKPASIADEQWEDSLFNRSAVTRAHQDLIRDLFTPGTR